MFSKREHSTAASTNEQNRIDTNVDIIFLLFSAYFVEYSDDYFDLMKHRLAISISAFAGTLFVVWFFGVRRRHSYRRMSMVIVPDDAFPLEESVFSTVCESGVTRYRYDRFEVAFVARNLHVNFG